MKKEIDNIEAVRRNNLNNLVKESINPYPSKAERTNSCQEADKDYDSLLNEEIILAGRIRLMRRHGKATFGNIQDQSSEFQIFFSEKIIGIGKYKLLKNIEVGDFIQVKGKLFTTKKNEKTLEVNNYKLLAKALKPLPEKWHGIKDDEERLRKRYLDILFNPEIRDLFKKKALFWQNIRKFFVSRGFTEVETPVLEVTSGGADAQPFITHHNALDIDLFLRISMGELWQKKLMVAGFEKTFEIGRQFRNEGIDAEHLQDYTQMEFYMAYANYEDGMNLVEEMHKEIIKKTFKTLKFSIRNNKIDFNRKWEKIDYVEKINKELNINVLKATDEELKEKCQSLNIIVDKKVGRGRLIDSIWKKVRKDITGPAFLINHPVDVSPLSKRKESDENIVERFQVIIAGSELGNGYSELNDPIDQAERFKEQVKLRELGDEEAQMHDKDFVEALEYGMPPTCGFGLSERLFSFLVDKPIRETVLFPLMRPKGVIQVRNNKSKDVDLKMNRKDAEKILRDNLKEEKNILHSRETEVIMKAVAKNLGENEDYWGLVGLLHDLDWEKTKDKPEEHTKITAKILNKAGFPQEGIDAIKSHNYDEAGEVIRNKKIDYALACSESITGIIYASALVKPDRRLESVNVKSIKKKIKDKSFAANVNRDMIKEHEKLGISLDEFIEISLLAMKSISDELGL